MKIVVCAKQIPDPAAPYSLEPDTHWLVRPAEQVLDDTDRYGVEMGLQLAQKHEGTVTLISMGPSGNLQGVRQALAMGANDAVLVDDTALKGSDALTTARVLSAAIARNDFDLVIAGTESTDGYAGVVPQMLAEMLGVPSLTYATHVDIADQSIRIHRQTADGYDEVSASLPAVLSVTAGVVEPRYPTFKGIMEAKKKTVETLTVAELGLEPDVDQMVKAVEPAAERSGGETIEDDGEAHLRIVEFLERAKVI